MNRQSVQPSPVEQGSPDQQALLEVADLTVSFPTPQGISTVVADLGFTLEPGASLGIVGESGSGKSMTSLAIMGLLPPSATRTGSIKLSGTELTTLSESGMRQLRGNTMSMIFQDPLSSLNPYYTIGLQITEAYRAHHPHVSRRELRKIAVDALDRVHIPRARERIDHYPHQFSGGMRQRVMIAMALCTEPDLLIADEPTTALDVTVQAQILELIAELRAETGTGLIMITHDLAVVAQVADQVVVMQHGDCVEQGSAQAVFSAPQHPYTDALLEAVPRIDDDIEDLRQVQRPAGPSSNRTVPGGSVSTGKEPRV